VELYNEGLTPNHPEVIARWFNEVLDAKPDLILWIVTPYDVQIGGAPDPQANPRAGPVAKALYAVKHRPPGESMPDAIRDVWTNYSRTAVLLRHILNTSPGLFLKSYLLGDDVSGYLKAEPSALWQRRLKMFDDSATSISAQARAAGVPLVVVQLPSRAQVMMVSTGIWSKEYDPYALGRALQAIVTSHGGAYIDVLPAYRNQFDVEKVYQSADEHPNTEGHALIARDLAGQLSSGLIPALDVNSRTQSQVSQAKVR
jgi:hypothetical protein